MDNQIKIQRLSERITTLHGADSVIVSMPLIIVSYEVKKKLWFEWYHRLSRWPEIVQQKFIHTNWIKIRIRSIDLVRLISGFCLTSSTVRDCMNVV
jgi:hypothetical protein